MCIVCLCDLGEVTGFSNIPLCSGEGVVHAGKFSRGIIVNVLVFWYVVFDCRVVLIAATGVLYNVWLIGTVSTIRILICVPLCPRFFIPGASPFPRSVGLSLCHSVYRRQSALVG